MRKIWSSEASPLLFASVFRIISLNKPVHNLNDPKDVEELGNYLQDDGKDINAEHVDSECDANDKCDLGYKNGRIFLS